MRSNVYLRKRQTKDGEIRYVLVIRQIGRREVWKNLGPISKKKAETIRIQILNDLLTGSYQGEPEVHLLFSEFVSKFFSDFANGSRAPRTLFIYRECLKPLLRRFRGLRLHDITRHDVEKYFCDWKVSGRTKNITLSILRLVFQKAVEWHYLTRSPMQGIRRFAEASQGSRALTPQELSLLLGDSTAWQSSVIKVLIYSGMRPGELSQLKFQDIDWENKRLAIVNDKTRKTKNRRTRYIPLNEELYQELARLREYLPVKNGDHDRGYEPRRPWQKEYFFCHQDGRPIKCFRGAIVRALRKHGIQGVTPHGFRKTFCSLLARKKVHPKVAQQLMGHSDISLTMRVYTEVDDEQLREAVHALPTLSELAKPRLQVINGARG